MRSVLGSIAFYTDYGRMMAIFKILYGHHHIWDIFGLGLKSKQQATSQQLNDENPGQGILTVPKYVLIVWLKICQISQSLFGRSALLAQM